jgi:hypothetical protein
MQIVEGIAKVLAFRTLPTTVLVVAIYTAIFGAVLYGDRVAKVPKNQKGLNLAQAYADLHHVRCFSIFRDYFPAYSPH